MREEDAIDIEDYDAELEKQRAKASSLKSDMKALLNNESYKFIQQKVQQQIDARMHSVLEMPASQDEVVKRTYQAGEIAGMKIVQNFAAIMLEEAENALAMTRAALGEDDGS